MFKKVFEVTFTILPLAVSVTEVDDDSDIEEDEVELTTLVVSTEDLSLQDFTNQLVASKAAILDGLGYSEADYESNLVKVEDVTDTNTVVMLPHATTH